MRSLEDRKILAAASALKKREKKAREASRAPRVIPTAKGQRQPRQEDRSYMTWLHQPTSWQGWTFDGGMPCIGCLLQIDMPPKYMINPIEIAHQKLAIASAGWKEGGGGKRTHDSRCVPLCRWHHQAAPNACDKGQRQFWDRMGLGDDIAAFATELHETFRSGAEPRWGAGLVFHWARIAKVRA